jgi:hypothetical protein
MMNLLLAEHHRAMEAACTDLLGHTYADEPFELVGEYRRFEHEVLAHLAAEEELLLPAYARHAPDDARELEEDHEELRRLLYRIAIDVELHVVRAATVDQLIARLREHAAHEEQGLYTWAAGALDALARDQLRARLAPSIVELDQLRARADKAHTRQTAVRRAITKALGRHAVAESRHIRVEVVDGEAELIGAVDSQHEHDAAIAAARAVPGIINVIDHLAICP